MVKKANTFFTRPIVLLLIGAFLLRIGIASFGTLTLDQNTFIAWAHIVRDGGFSNFYNTWSDYLPGYVYVLWVLSKLEVILPIPSVILYKLPAIIVDIASGYLVYALTRRLKGERSALIASALVLLNPAFIANSTLWGQVDVLTGFFAVLSIFALPSSWILSAISLAVGSAIKPQAALAAPIVLMLLFEKKAKVNSVLKYILTSGFVFVLFFVPFANGQNIFQFIIYRLGITLGQYPYTSINAFNFWGFWGFWRDDSIGLLSPKNVGYIIFALTSAFAYLKLKKVKNKEYVLLSILFLSNFLFFTRMHERHLLPALLPLSIGVAIDSSLIFPFLVFSLIYVLNMYYSYVWITENFKSVFSNVSISFFVLVEILSLKIILFKEKWGTFFEIIVNFFKSKTIVTKAASFFNTKKDSKLVSAISEKKIKLLLFAIIAFALVTRLIGLGNPEHEYFDEVYHAFTARAMLHGDLKAWEWWNPNPSGFAYEWTHPPFAKEAMVIGMLIFGENSFGWRVPAALFGTGVVLLIYLISSKLFNKEIGLLSAFVFSLDGLGLVMSRIGMNDIYLVFFLLLSLLLFINEKYFYSALALGFAAASKWTTFWFFPVLFAVQLFRGKAKPKDLLSLAIPPILFFGSIASLDSVPAAYIALGLIGLFVLCCFYFRKKMGVLYLLFIPLIIYFLSYLPLFVSGHSWDIFWGMQRQMWWYHTRLVATHPYESGWWSWPFLLRPIWLYTGGENSGQISNIYAMGNPFIFWGGFVSVLAGLYYSFLEKRKNLLLIIVAYGGVFVPWALSPRIMFLYHYFPAIPFLSIATGFVLYKNKTLILTFLVLSTVAFLYFYPHWTAISVPVAINDSYFWLPGWR